MKNFAFHGLPLEFLMWELGSPFKHGMIILFPVSVYQYTQETSLPVIQIFIITGPHQGIPNVLMQENNRVAQVDPSRLPSAMAAVEMYEAHDRRLTLFSPYGHDPLADDATAMAQREEKFHERFPDFAPFFYSIVNGNHSMFREGLLHFIQISKQCQTEKERSPSQ